MYALRTVRTALTVAQIYHGLNGVEIFGNGSGSHHQLRKLHTRVSFMISATEKSAHPVAS